MSDLRDVFCWVTGPARRELVLRLNREAAGDLTGQAREIARIKLPAGMYAMLGPQFQTLYTHEFPQMYSTLYKQILAHFRLHKDQYNGFPSDDEELLQAEWLAENADVVRRELSRGGAIELKRGANYAQRLRDYEDWRKWRTSHTLRRFKSDP